VDKKKRKKQIKDATKPTKDATKPTKDATKENKLKNVVEIPK